TFGGTSGIEDEGKKIRVQTPARVKPQGRQSVTRRVTHYVVLFRPEKICNVQGQAIVRESHSVEHIFDERFFVNPLKLEVVLKGKKGDAANRVSCQTNGISLAEQLRGNGD
ncbi:hypothetical protein AMTR_s00122p00092210, partial [Amborella trichopoda]